MDDLPEIDWEMIKSYLPKLNNRMSILRFMLHMTALFSVALFISACVVADTANAGFNVVFTSLLNCGLTGGSIYVLKNSKSPLAIGFLMGSTAMMAVINFETAVYWGQLSSCKHLYGGAPQYSCGDRAAYGAVSAFSVLLLLFQMGFTSSLFMWRADFIDESGVYDGILETHSSSGHDSHRRNNETV